MDGVVYIIIFIILSILSFIKFEKKQEEFLLYVIVVFLILFIGLSYGNGTDIFTYSKLYYLRENIPKFQLQRTGYFLEIYFWLLNRFKFNFSIVKFILNIFTVYFFCKATLKFYKKNKILLILLLFSTGLFGLTLNTIKQGIAVIFFTYSLYELQNKNSSRYFLYNILGGLFHSSLFIIAVLFYIYSKIDLNRKKYIILFIITLLIGKFFNFIHLVKLFGDSSKYYKGYFDGDALHGISYNILNYIEYQIPCLISLYLTYKIKIKMYYSKRLEVIMKAYYFGILIINLWISTKFIVVRFTPYFMVPSIILYVLLCENLLKNKKITKFILIIFVGILFYLRVINHRDFKNYESVMIRLINNEKIY